MEIVIIEEGMRDVLPKPANATIRLSIEEVATVLSTIIGDEIENDVESDYVEVTLPITSLEHNYKEN